MLRTALLLTLLPLLTACGGSQAGNVYNRSQAQRQLLVSYATVISTEPVTIEGRKGVLGAVAGGVVGGIAGSTVGGGHGRDLATAAGAIGGAVAGAAIEERATRQNAMEITVQLDNGKTIAVVQEDSNNYRPGERVRIINGPDGVTRIRR